MVTRKLYFLSKLIWSESKKKILQLVSLLVININHFLDIHIFDLMALHTPIRSSSIKYSVKLKYDKNKIWTSSGFNGKVNVWLLWHILYAPI